MRRKYSHRPYNTVIGRRQKNPIRRPDGFATPYRHRAACYTGGSVSLLSATSARCLRPLGPMRRVFLSLWPVWCPWPAPRPENVSLRVWHIIELSCLVFSCRRLCAFSVHGRTAQTARAFFPGAARPPSHRPPDLPARYRSRCAARSFPPSPSFVRFCAAGQRKNSVCEITNAVIPLLIR